MQCPPEADPPSAETQVRSQINPLSAFRDKGIPLIMPEPQERHYNIEKLNRLFAIASLVLLAALVLMFADDYSRKWKDYQKEFRQLEIEKTRVKFDKESNRLIKDEAYVKLEGDIAEAQKVFNAQCSQFAELDKKLDRKSTRLNS